MKCVTKSWRQLTVGTHRTFRVLFAVQWAVARRARLEIVAAGRVARPVHADPGRPCCRCRRCCSRAPRRKPAWVRHFMAACQIGWSMLFMWLLEGQLRSAVPRVRLAGVPRVLSRLARARDGDARRHRLSDRAHRAAARLLRDRRVGLVARVRPGASGWSADAVIMLLAVLQSLKTIQEIRRRTPPRSR